MIWAYVRCAHLAITCAVNKINRTGSNVLASTINNTTGENNISEPLYEHYKQLLNSNGNDQHKPEVLSVIDNINVNSDFQKFSAHDIREVISKLETNKSAGTDLVQSEHFIYALDKISCLLSMLFNSMFMHNYLASKLMETIIVPIIKDKKGLVTDKNTYRPIAVTSVSSKIIELILLDRLRDKLATLDNQF